MKLFAWLSVFFSTTFLSLLLHDFTKEVYVMCNIIIWQGKCIEYRMLHISLIWVTSNMPNGVYNCIWTQPYMDREV